jgi:N-acetylglucosaminyl-diphospho-decaprenol L-rhamnosyltransferase
VLATPRTAFPSDGDSALIGVLVLNYNGRALLEECLPSMLAAAEASRHACRVIVVDNDPADGSAEFLALRFPQVEVVARPNRGLCSFNDVLAALSCPVAVLLNNDIKLDRACIDPLVEPLLRPSLDEQCGSAVQDNEAASRCFMTAPRCWLFDGVTYEGLKTAVRWRWGLVQATSLFPGHENVIDVPGPTASAGAAMAVDRRLFLELGGFDALYLPGRIEDLDFAFRGYVAGYQALYVPGAVAYHRGMATFGPAFSLDGCDHLALRNTLLFQWKNLRHPAHVLRQVVGLPIRVLRDLVTAPFLPRGRRLATCRALAAAWQRRRQIRPSPRPSVGTAREAAFFREFHPRHVAASLRDARASLGETQPRDGNGSERLRDRRHPISRWYLLPLADWMARRLAQRSIRPWHVTLTGAGIAVLAALCLGLGLGTIAAALVLAVWFCDRLDGKLARRQQRETRWGAWLDANLDELTDLGLHGALAWAAATAAQSSLPWALFTAFLFGKYLFVYGLASDEPTTASGHGARNDDTSHVYQPAAKQTWLRWLYHLPGNADVRMHLLALLVAAGWWTAELLLVAVYFNARWIARYALVARRQSGPLAPRAEPLSRAATRPHCAPEASHVA